MIKRGRITIKIKFYRIREIISIFFPRNMLEKYRHIGYSYGAVPSGWLNIVNDAIIKIEKIMWPQRYLPMFVKRLIHYLATGNSGYFIKNKTFHKLRGNLTRNQIITDIKDKYAGLRIYGYYNDEIDDIIEKASDLCDKTCENCGSNEDTQIVGERWYRNLCINCRNNGE